MSEKMLLIIAALAIALGLPLLFFAAQTELQATSLSIEGTVNKVVHKKDLTIAYITTEVPVVYFKKASVQKGEHISVPGRLQEYKGQVEFVAD